MAKDIEFPNFCQADIENQIIDFACSVIRAERTDGKPDPIPSGWIVRGLIDHGMLAWRTAPEELDGGMYFAAPSGAFDRYGKPGNVFLTNSSTFSGMTVKVGDDCRVIRANSTGRPLRSTIKRYAEMLNWCDIATRANIPASMRTQLVKGLNKATVQALLWESWNGRPAVVMPDRGGKAVTDAEIGTVDLSVPLKAQDYRQLAATLWGEVLKMFGGITPAQYKAERTQSAEVSAQIAGSIDSVYVLIDTANDDMAAGGVPYRLVYDGFGARYDAGEPDPEKEEEKDE